MPCLIIVGLYLPRKGVTTEPVPGGTASEERPFWVVVKGSKAGVLNLWAAGPRIKYKISHISDLYTMIHNSSKTVMK